MKKKEYIRPALNITQVEVRELVAVSVTGVQTTGLDEGLNVDEENKEGNIWNDAWAKKQSSNSAWEDDWSE